MIGNVKFHRQNNLEDVENSNNQNTYILELLTVALKDRSCCQGKHRELKTI